MARWTRLLMFSYALTWLGAFLGLLVNNPKTADALMPLTFPIAMLANTFVPTGGMPAVLRVIAEWNPVSCTVTAIRTLFGNPGVVTAHTEWPIEHAVPATLGWSILLIVVFMPLTVWRFTHAGR